MKKLQSEDTNTIKKLNKEIKLLNQKNFELKADNDKLRITNTLLGSSDNKRDTKLKINSLIKEIDACIAYMAN